MSITVEIKPNRELHITLPEDTPLGLAEIIIVVSPAAHRQMQTFGDVLNSEFFGMWRDREDITDSAEFARQLRHDAWSRSK